MNGGDGLDDLPDYRVDQPAVSVGAIFDRAAEQGLELHVIQGTVPDDMPIDAGARARLAHWLSDGWVAIAPVTPVDIGGASRIGWWLVDPATGRTVDELENGRGGLIEDALVKLRVLWTSARPYICLGGTIYELYHFWHGLYDTVPGDKYWLQYVMEIVGSNRIHKWGCH